MSFKDVSDGIRITAWVCKSLTCDATNLFQNIINELLANGVVPSSVVVRRILFPTDQELGMEKLSVWTGSDFVDRGWIEIDENGTGDMFVVAGLGEEGLEGTRVTNVGIGVRTTVRLQAVLEEVPGGDVRNALLK